MNEQTPGPSGKRRGRSLTDFHMLVYRLFQAQRAYLRPRIHELGMGPGQPKLVVYIALHGASTQREVADFFELDPATTCRMLEALEREGLVQSRPGSDRRKKEYLATPAGKKVVDGWDACCDEQQDVLLEGFSPEEREQFRGYLRRGYENLARAAYGHEAVGLDD